MIRRRDGLTLLEVVLAIALLSILVVVVLPVLVDATRAAVPRADRVDAKHLRALLETHLAADGALERLRRAGVQEVALRLADSAGEATDVRLRWIAQGDEPPAHDWIEAISGETRVLRYVPQARDAEDEGKREDEGSASPGDRAGTRR